MLEINNTSNGGILMDGKKLFNIGIFLTFLGLGLQILLSEINVVFGSIISTMGIIFLIRGHLMQKNPEKIKKDERSRKIGAWAASYSWMLTIFALMIIFWIDKLFLSLSVEVVVGGIYIVMVTTLLFYKWYFNKKGDIL